MPWAGARRSSYQEAMDASSPRMSTHEETVVEDAPSSTRASARRTREAGPLVGLEPIFERILATATRRVDLVQGEAKLSEALRTGHRFVIALNHGPMHLPIVPVSAMGHVLLRHAGAALRLVGVFFRPFYYVPGLSAVIRHLTQLDEPATFDSLVDGFESDAWDGVVVMPDGANCVFTDPHDLPPFASPRFVELAARVDATILLFVHSGLEGYAQAVPMPEVLRRSWLLRRLPYGLGKAIAKTPLLALPSLSAGRADMRFAVDLHRPSITSAELAAMATEERRAWVAGEAAIVRAKMLALHAALATRAGRVVG